MQLGIECLHASHVGAHQVDGSIEDVLLQRPDISLLNQQAADLVQPPRIVSSRTNWDVFVAYLCLYWWTRWPSGLGGLVFTQELLQSLDELVAARETPPSLRHSLIISAQSLGRRFGRALLSFGRSRQAVCNVIVEFLEHGCFSGRRRQVVSRRSRLRLMGLVQINSRINSASAP